MAVEKLITEHIDIWTSAVKSKSTSGRGSSKKLELYGVKKLRELILELAVRGKLVPQDPNDEPASVLLERIAAEKARLVKEKKITKPKKLAEVCDDEFSFELPSNWDIRRLPDVYYTISPSGKKLKSSDVLEHGTYPVIDQGQEAIAGYSNDEERVIDIESPIIIFGDHTRNIKYVDFSFVPGADGTKILCPIGIAPEFFYLQLRSYDIESRGYGRHFKILNENLFVIPSLEEQHRIVAKVDELMALCDQLEQQTEASIEAHQVLVTTLLDTLTNSADADELMQNWARISEHFDTLFTTEESIDQLKQTILQLAVMGKLVPQDPNDEPVSKLLERIKNHQLDRVQRKEIQKPKKASVSTILKMDIPKCWKSLLLNDLVFVTKLAGFEYTKYINLEDAGDVAVIRAQNVRSFKPDLENLKFIDNETSLNLPRSAIDRPSLLVTFIGAGIGDVCVFNEEKRWHLAPNVAKIEPYADLNLEYLCIYLNSPVGRGELFKSMKSTAQPSLSMTTIREIWVALPPVDEQKRIVTEVNKLFTLCDQLAVRLKASQVVQLHLTNVIAEQAI